MLNLRRFTFGLLFPLVLASGCEWPFASEPEPVADANAEVVAAPEVRGVIALTDVTTEPAFVGGPGVDAYGYPVERVDAIALLTLVRLRRFDDLDRVFDHYQDRFEADFRNEYWPMGALWAFSVSDPEVGERLDEWVATKPQSYAALAARGSYHFDLARSLRGGAWAKDTPPAQMRAMAAELDLAAPDLEAALRLRPKLVAARVQLLGIAKFRGDDPSERAQLEAALETCPDCYLPRMVYLLARAPRWGGSYPEMQAVVDSAADKLEANPRLALLAGMIDLEHCELASFAKKWSVAHKACDAGLAHGDEPNLLNVKGGLFRSQEQYASALTPLDRALAISPFLQSALERRFIARFATDDVLGAGRDLLTLRQMDPTSDFAANNVKRLADKLASEGDERTAEGDHLGAAEYFGLGLELAPQYLELVKRRGANQLRMGFDDVQTQLAAAPDDFELRQRIDYGLSELGRFDEILPIWDAYLTDHPGDPRAYYERGGTKWRMRNFDAALTDFDRACSMGMRHACEDAERAKKRLARTGNTADQQEPSVDWALWIGLGLLAGLLGLLAYMRRSNA